MDASKRTVSHLLAETVTASLEKSASQGALDACSKSLQEMEPAEVPQTCTSVPINPPQYARANGMQTPSRASVQSSIARYASGMKSRMSQAAPSSGTSAMEMPSLWSMESAGLSTAGVGMTRLHPKKSSRSMTFAAVMRAHKGSGKAQAVSRRGAAVALTKRNSLASIASAMKATSGNTLGCACSRQTMKERHSSPGPHANTFEQPIRGISFEQGALSISRESSCSNVRFLSTGTSSMVSSDVATPHMSGPLTFAAAMSQRPPMLGTLGGFSRGSSFTSITISAQASQPGVAQPLLQHMSRAHSSPSPLIAGNKADSKSQAVNTPRRRTLQGPHDSGSLDCSGFHNSQALTPIRSGQVESFQRPVQPWQPFRSAFGDASLHNTGDMFSWPSESERSTASALLTSSVPDKTVSPAESVGPKRSPSGGPLTKLKRMCSTSFLGNMLGRVGPNPQRRPRGLSDAQAKQEQASLTFGLAQDLQPGVSAPAIMQESCDAAIATLGIRQAPVQVRSVLQRASTSALAKDLHPQPSKAVPSSPFQTCSLDRGPALESPEGLLSGAALKDVLSDMQSVFASTRSSENLTRLRAPTQADPQAPRSNCQVKSGATHSAFVNANACWV